MPPRARDYKPSTVKRLFALSYNQCYYPTCSRTLVSEEDEKIILAKIAHIEAASADGPRFRENMTDDERRDFNNLILLCDEHHLIIDNKENEEEYSTELLKQWKDEHEQKGLKKSNIALTKLPFSSLCIGRESELGDIEEILKSKDSLLLLNGIGGIGKTTLAKEYIKEYIGLYDHIAYVEYKDDIKTSFISAFTPHYKLEAQTIDERFDELIYKLQSQSGNNLLVIDNLQSQKDINKIKDLGSNFKLLITSRKKFKNIESYHVGTLSPEKAKELFFKSYNTDENIDELLKYIGYHTLFITLTAEALSHNDTLTIQILEERFSNGKFGNISNLDDDFEEKKFIVYLQELFIANNLKDEDIFVLKRLSLFPSIYIEYDELKVLLRISDDKEAEFSIILKRLSSLGWLIKDNNIYKLHQIIKEFIVSNYSVNYFDCEDIINFFISLLSALYNKNPIEAFKLIPYIVDFNKLLSSEISEMTKLMNVMSLLYQEMGDLNKALKYQSISFNNSKKIFGKEHESVVAGYNNMCAIHQEMGKFDKALEYQKEALKIAEKIFNRNDQKLATCYNNLSESYRINGHLEESLFYQKKALKLRKKILDEKDPLLILSYNNLSLILKQMGKFEMALNLQKKVITLYEDILDMNDPRLAKAYNNMAVIYEELEEFENALSYQKKSIEIFENIFERNHPTLALAYNNIAVTYLYYGDLENSQKYVNKALKIMEINFPEGHPHLDILLNTQNALYKMEMK